MIPNLDTKDLLSGGIEASIDSWASRLPAYISQIYQSPCVENFSVLER